MDKFDMLVCIPNVKDLGTDPDVARAHMANTVEYVYTERASNDEGSIQYGVHGGNVVRYLAFEIYVGDYLELPKTETFPFSDLDEIDQTAVAEIARTALFTPTENLLRAADISDEEAKRLLDKLTLVLGKAPNEQEVPVEINAEFAELLEMIKAQVVADKQERTTNG